MPDIQTEMKKVMQAWEQPYPITQPIKEPEMTNTTPRPTAFVQTTGVTEATFNIVRDQSGLPKKEYIRILSAQGYKKASTSSILSQMIKQGQIWVDSSGFLQPNQKAYTPLKGHYKRRAPVAKVVKSAKTFKVKTSESKGIVSLVPTATPTDRVQEIMNTLSLPDAKRLYNSLATYFATP